MRVESASAYAGQQVTVNIRDNIIFVADDQIQMP